MSFVKVLFGLQRWNVCEGLEQNAYNHCCVVWLPQLVRETNRIVTGCYVGSLLQRADNNVLGCTEVDIG